MANATYSIKPLMICPKCGQEIRSFGTEAESPKRDLFTFECDKCEIVEVRGARVP
jgi:predicted  nucleic acid-binding Zn ribbon protein